MSPLVDLLLCYYVINEFVASFNRGLDGFVTSLDLWPCWICGFAEFTATMGLWTAIVCGLKEFGPECVFDLPNTWPDRMGALLCCGLKWVALLDPSHGRFWIAP